MPHADICSLDYAKNIKKCGWGIVHLIAELDTMIELLNCDCMEYMATVPDKYFDLAIVDPPYGINEGKTKRPSRGNTKTKQHTAKDWDKEPATNEYFEHLFRVSKQQNP